MALADHPPGTVGVCADELSRFTPFMVSMATVTMPPGSTIRVAMGRNIVRQSNRLVSECEGDWLWLMGDDHVFATDTLIRLLDHRADVVVPLVLMRQHPFHPVVFEAENADGTMRVVRDLPATGLHEVYAAGTAGMLIRRHVLDALGDGPFAYTPTDGEALGEDLTFCKRIRAAGYRIFVDTDTRLGHLTVSTVWPDHTGESGWRVRVDFNGGAQAKD